jgi:hypothetical protein
MGFQIVSELHGTHWISSFAVVGDHPFSFSQST